MLYEDVSQTRVDGYCCMNIGKDQHISVSYDPTMKVTKITCLADIVTVGIAAKYLQEKFNEALDEVPEEAKRDLLKAIEEVLIK